MVTVQKLGRHNADYGFDGSFHLASARVPAPGRRLVIADLFAADGDNAVVTERFTAVNESETQRAGGRFTAEGTAVTAAAHTAVTLPR